MILHDLKVEGFRCFRNPIAIEGLGPGVGVIHAPNETGKSTLVLAMARALFDKYKTKFDEFVPWNTQLTPRIEVVFSAGGETYRLEKQFVKKAFSILSRKMGGGFERIADSNAADERVRDMFTSSVPGRGLTVPPRWGLARLLWLTQDEHRHAFPIPEEALGDRLMSLVGGVRLSDAERRLRERIRVEYENHFTARRGAEKKSNPAVKLRQDLDAIEERIARLVARREEADQIDQDLEAARIQKRNLDGEIVDYRERLETYRSRREEESSTLRLAQRKEEEVRELTTRLERLRAQEANLDRLDEQITQADRLLSQGAPRIDQVSQELAHASLELENRREDVGKLQERVHALVSHHQTCLEVVTFLQSRIEQIERLQLKDQVSQLTEHVSSLKRELDESPRPAPADLDRAEGLDREIRVLAGRLEVIGLGVEVRIADGPLDLRWTTGDRVQEERASGEEPVTFKGVDEGTLFLEGVGEVRIRSGSTEVQEENQRRETLTRELATLLGSFEVTTVEQLRDLAQVAQRLKVDIDATLNTRTHLLAPRFADIEDLDDKIREQERRSRRRLEAIELDEELAGLCQVDDARILEGLDRARQVLEGVEEESLEVQNRLREESGVIDRLEKASREIQKRLEALESEQRDLQVQRETYVSEKEHTTKVEGSLEDIRKTLQDLVVRHARAEEAARGLRGSLPPDAERADSQVESLEKALQGALEEVHRLQIEETRSRTRLETILDEGAYSKLNSAREEARRLSLLLDEALRRQAALALLRNLVEDRVARTTRTLADPIQENVSRMLGYIRGGRGENFDLHLDPEITRARLDLGDGNQSDLDPLSFGVRDQLLVCVRLALGQLLATRGPDPQPQLVVLDDPLVNTDEVRQERVLELIEQAADGLQILILTAFPSTYRRIAGRMIDLAALKI